jgi:myo-inositol-1(or 4)-monophosphatase
MDLQALLSAAFEASNGASEILSSYFGNLHRVSEKFQAGLVSEADRESEKFIEASLLKRFPDHSFLGEETGLTKGRDSVSNWIVDPLDGTTNYVHQFPFFAISIGFEHKGEMLVGVVDAPKLGMRFHAVKGAGAFLNGRAIHVSQRSEWKDGLFATGFPVVNQNLTKQFALIQKTLENARGVRRAGAASLDLCFVAQGSFDLYWEENLAPWDTAAGFLIAAEAGATVTNLEGQAFNPYMKSIVAGNPALHSQFLNLNSTL